MNEHLLTDAIHMCMCSSCRNMSIALTHTARASCFCTTWPHMELRAAAASQGWSLKSRLNVPRVMDVNTVHDHQTAS